MHILSSIIEFYIYINNWQMFLCPFSIDSKTVWYRVLKFDVQSEATDGIVLT